MGRPNAALVLSSELGEQLDGLASWPSLTAGLVRRGTFRRVKKLVEKIDPFVHADNPVARPFAWTATADSIFSKIQQPYERIAGNEQEEFLEYVQVRLES